MVAVDKNTGKIFTHVNTHLDNESREARIFQASVLMNFTAEFKDMPVFITGDFHCVSTEETYKTVINGGFSNAALIAPVAEKQATFPGSCGPAESARSSCWRCWGIWLWTRPSLPS